MRGLILALSLAGSALLTSNAVGADKTALEKVATYVSRTVGACWAIPVDVEPIVTRVQISLNRDGSLAGPPKILNPTTQPQGKIVNASAVRAIVRCTPFTGLGSYGDSYQVWRDMVIGFDSRELAASELPKFGAEDVEKPLNKYKKAE